MITKLRNVCLVLLISYISSCPASYASKPTRLYVNVGDSLTLQCIVDSYNGASWEGPCARSKKCFAKKQFYYDGLMKYPDLTFVSSILTGTREGRSYYDLHFPKVASENKGFYTCFGFSKNSTQETIYEVLFKVKPSHLRIENASDEGRLYGTEDEMLELKCSVTSGLPEETMTWYRKHSVVKKGGPGVISYSLFPTRKDHGENFTCQVQSEAIDEPLKKTVTLDIRYRPIVSFSDTDPLTIEGKNYLIQCHSEGNPPAALTHIRKDDNKTADMICETSTCSMMLSGSRFDSGTYICVALNKVGGGNSTTRVKVLYPPDITISTPNETTLGCIVKGEPTNSTFVSWKHFSEHGTLIRSFNGSEYLTLCQSSKKYMVNGVYACEASNGIPNTSGKAVMSGSHSIKIQGTPEILPKTKRRQYGKYKDSATIQIYIYSIPKITMTKILKNGVYTDISAEITKSHDLSEYMFGKNVVITGYIIRFDTTVLEETDFTNYTFIVRNDWGSVNYTVSLDAKDIPLAPEIDLVSVKNSEILIKFKRNFNGGSDQIFVVEYRPIFAKNWTVAAIINDTAGEIISCKIQDLKQEVEYCVQVFSRNSVGCSNSSAVCSLWTVENTHEIYLYIAFGIGLSLILFVTTLLFRKGRDVLKWLMKKFEIHENNFVGDQQEQLDEAAVENQLYLSFDSLPRIQIRQANGYAYQNATTSQRSISPEEHNLNYAELEFAEVSQPFYIHGGDRTIYSEIDHSLTAPPLESSDSEEENDDEDDFMSLEEISEFMREKGLTPPFDD